VRIAAPYFCVFLSGSLEKKKTSRVKSLNSFSVSLRQALVCAATSLAAEGVPFAEVDSIYVSGETRSKIKSVHKVECKERHGREIHLRCRGMGYV